MTEKKYPSDAQERFMLRLPDGMRDRIAAEAKKNNRSMNAEIVSVLQWHYNSLDGVGHAMQNKSDEKMVAFMQDLRSVMMPHMAELFLKHGVLQELAKHSLEQDDPESKP